MFLPDVDIQFVQFGNHLYARIFPCKQYVVLKVCVLHLPIGYCVINASHTDKWLTKYNVTK